MVQLAHTAAPAFRRHSLALAAGATLALCAASATLAPQTAHAQAQAPSDVRSYAIPAGPLEGALARFSQESRVMLSYTAADIAGRRSAGLSGSHAAAAALDALLAGTGLAAHAQPNGG
jgi:iron complex outermembrane receptor protein/outer membrane receptor for ferric coprogen and ferric-rhodotorulic acid